MMNADSVKQGVIAGYGKLAQATQGGIFSKLFSCCDGEHTKQIGQVIGYSSEELDAVPQDSNLGVGCGNPSSMTKIKEGQTVVDLGSGAGFDAFLVSPLVGATGKVIGVDLSVKMLALANKNANTGNYKNVSFVHGDIELLPLDDELADHVISNCVINLSLNKGMVYKEAYRVLKKGGKLAISDVVLEQELPEKITKSLSGHLACVSGAEKLDIYLGYIEQAGFRNIKLEKKDTFPLELMLNDPQIRAVAKELNFDLSGEEAREMGSRVQSVSISAEK